ncbi:hypothetical protein CsatA_010507 [Cannabis sativa]
MWRIRYKKNKMVYNNFLMSPELVVNWARDFMSDYEKSLLKSKDLNCLRNSR